ncbi:MAG: MBL fold metallo-hydrolase [Gammaproteobacteria bacterium]|nr:MBL fold metallo-hydrolase [Gammaproteobacteria bacterium]
MRFASLGSGSRGNAMLVETGSTCLMVDCGFSIAETVRRLARLGRSPEELSALLVTHEHSDHIRGVLPFARRHGIPVWMTHGTAAALPEGELPPLHAIAGYADFHVGDIHVQPYPVPHDAREPCQFLFHSGRHRLGLLTDCGSLTPHIVATLQGCDALVLEFNHDPEMLARGSYPPALKRRVGGDYGHLNNHQACRLLEQIELGPLQHLVAAHLSEKNNAPERVRERLDAFDGRLDYSLACQDGGFDWRTLE